MKDALTVATTLWHIALELAQVGCILGLDHDCDVRRRIVVTSREALIAC
jgi:hypothetical protein